MLSWNISRTAVLVRQTCSSSRSQGARFVLSRSAATSASVSRANGSTTPNPTPSRPKAAAATESPPSTSVSETARDYNGDGSKSDWSRSYHGLSLEPFPKETANILQAPLNPEDIEIKPGKSVMNLYIATSLQYGKRRVDIPSRNQI